MSDPSAPTSTHVDIAPKRRGPTQQSRKSNASPQSHLVFLFLVFTTIHYIILYCITLHLLCLDDQSDVIIIGYIQQSMHTLYALDKTADSMYRFTCKDLQAVNWYLGNRLLLYLEDQSTVTIPDLLGSRCLQIECIRRICKQHVPIYTYESIGREMVSQQSIHLCRIIACELIQEDLNQNQIIIVKRIEIVIVMDVDTGSFRERADRQSPHDTTNYQWPKVGYC